MLFLLHLSSLSFYKDTEDHFDVKAAIIALASKWKHIGGALGIPPDVLDAIQRSAGSDQSEAISQIVTKWLAQSYNVEKFGKPSWELLIKAVAHEAGGADRGKAEKIAKEHQILMRQFVSETSLHSQGSSGIFARIIVCD